MHSFENAPLGDANTGSYEQLHEAKNDSEIFHEIVPYKTSKEKEQKSERTKTWEHRNPNALV